MSEVITATRLNSQMTGVSAPVPASGPGWFAWRRMAAKLIDRAWSDAVSARKPGLMTRFIERARHRLGLVGSALEAARMPNVDLKRGFIFVHIPKNAGTSIVTALGLSGFGHATAGTMVAPLKRFFPELRAFTVVRNPFDRLVSLYEYARMPESYHHSASDPKRARFGSHRDYSLLKEASFDECVDLLVGNALHNGSPHVMWRPQTSWLIDHDGRLLVDYIARFESLADDLPRICRELNLSLPGLAKLNASTRQRDYRAYYSEYSRRVASAYYQSDCERFGYEF